MDPVLAGVVAGLSGVALGWVLNELSASIKARAERRKPVARALADLLEIRNAAFLLRRVLQAAPSHIVLPPEATAAAEDFLAPLVMDPGTLSPRYNAAVDAVAEVDPILAFRLRSRDRLPVFLGAMKRLVPPGFLVAHGLPDLPEELRSLLEDDFDNLIMEVARLHGWRTCWAVRRRLRGPLVFEPEAEELFRRYFARVAEIVRAEGGSLGVAQPR